MPLRIGLRVEPHPTGEEGVPVDGGLLERAAQAEAQGFDVLWVAERPTREDALVPSALVLCAAAAACTQHLRVATGLLALPLHHPLRVAEDAATLDLISGGRFELGVGLGSDPGGLEPWGVSRGDRAERFAEAVDLVRLAFRGQALAFRGRHWNVSGLEVLPTPSTPGGPRLWIGASRPEAQQAAAHAGAGLMLPDSADPTPYLEASRAGATRGDPRLAWLLPAGPIDEALSTATELLGRSPLPCVDLVVPDAPGPDPLLLLDALRSLRAA